MAHPGTPSPSPRPLPRHAKTKLYPRLPELETVEGSYTVRIDKDGRVTANGTRKRVEKYAVAAITNMRATLIQFPPSPRQRVSGRQPGLRPCQDQEEDMEEEEEGLAALALPLPPLPPSRYRPLFRPRRPSRCSRSRPRRCSPALSRGRRQRR
jgi:hypothetical protein